MPDGSMAALLLAGEFLFRLSIAALVILRRTRHSSTLAWVVVIMVLPVVGALLYLLTGETRIGRRRSRRHDEIRERIQAICASHWAESRYPELSRQYQPIATLAEGVGGTAPRGGNALSLFGDTDRVLDLLVEDIGRASAHCHLLFYIYLPDGSGRKLAAALMDAARRGVACRLLVDGVGSAELLSSSLARELRAAGVRLVSALPATPLRALFARLDLRNHRKLAVIDGVIGYTGSQNIADASFAPKPRFAPWVDCMVRIEGPAARDLQEVFVTDWYQDAEEPLEEVLELEPPSAPDGMTVQVIPSGPGYDNESMASLIQVGFHVAREEIVFTTPYFVPDEATVVGLCTAARRGVHTALVVPARNDSPLVSLASRSYYQSLLDAGVEIWEYTAGLLHAKTVTIDRDVAVITTANLDRRSMELNFEVSTLVFDTDFASQLRFLQRSYVEDSLRVDPWAWRERPWTRRLVQNAAGLTSPLL